MTNPRCWGFRIATDRIEYLATELEEGRLRQGWGWKEGQDLKNLTFDGGARRNLRMLEVRRGDLLLVPRLPEGERVAIVEATEDWDSGYKFCISTEHGDFGHIFPARLLRSFAPENEHVGGAIRTTLRNRARFWNVDRLHEDISGLLHADGDLGAVKAPFDKALDTAASVFKNLFPEADFEAKVFEELNRKLEGKDWEPVVEGVLRALYPTGTVEVVQGRSETWHGTDVLVRLPDLTGNLRYAIAIQVKDHVGQVTAAAVDQIGKADYWESEDCKVIEKVVVFTQATGTDNPHLKELAGKDVQIVFGEELRKILGEWARRHAAASLL